MTVIYNVDFLYGDEPQTEEVKHEHVVLPCIGDSLMHVCDDGQERMFKVVNRIFFDYRRPLLIARLPGDERILG